MTRRTRKLLQRGFTLIELSLVMAFIAILLIAIIFTSLYMGRLYAKGITNRNINQIGRLVSDTVRRDFAAANPNNITAISTGSGTALSGRICLGNISYVWNTADLLNNPSATKITHNGKDSVFERITDSAGSLCAQAGNGSYVVNIPASTQGTNLLDGNGREFAVYDLSVRSLSSAANQAVYSIDITIGTNEVGTTQRTGSNFVQCKPPADNSSNFDYCSVAKFNVVVRTGGGNR